MEEWDKAEQLNYKLTARETEQEADGFRLRAQKELTDPSQRAAAKEDLQHAKDLYSTIRNYNDVPHRLQLVAQDEMASTPPRAPAQRTAAARPAKSARQSRRTEAWQSRKAGRRRKS
jgi:hypothetical protein